MGIVHFRVDSRLIHGQVALTWSKFVNPNHIIVANDMVSQNPAQQALLKVAAPKQVRLSMIDIPRVIAYIKRGLAPNENVFLLCQNVVDANKFYKEGLEYKDLNIGNLIHKTGSIQLSEKLFVTEEELAALREMIAGGVNVYYQVLPTDPKYPLQDFLKKKNLERP